MYKLLYIILLQLILCQTARILVVIPTPVVSHQSVFKPLTKELAERGHNVTVFSVDPTETEYFTSPNLEEINQFHRYKGKYRKNLTNDVVEKRKMRNKVCELVHKVLIEEMLESDELQKLMQRQYDILILEAWVQPILIISHIFKVPVIVMSTMTQDAFQYEVMAAPFHPLLYTSHVHEKNYNLSFYEKVSLIHYEVDTRQMSDEFNNNFDNWLKKSTGASSPRISELKSNINVLFWHSHPIWDGVPVPANIVSIWGINRKPKKDLPSDLKEFLDNSANGVIYVSFGSLVERSMLPLEKIQVFIRVFSQLPYDVLWKWSKDELLGLTRNIKISKWVPQTDVLEHPKIKLFISHGGLQSTEESVYAGVPLIGIPVYGDQWANTEKYVYHRIGLQLQLHHLHDEELRKAIDTVISDESYRQNIQRLSALLRDQPQTPLERAVWWTEHVLRHSGAAHLRAPAANISWKEYHQIDILFIIFSILFIALILLFSIIRFMWFRSLMFVSNLRSQLSSCRVHRD